MSTNHPEVKQIFETIAANLAQAHGAELKRLFARPSINVGGKMAVHRYGEALVFKLSGDEREAALALDGAEVWNLSGKSMKNWIIVPKTHRDKWPELAHQAVLNVQAAIL